MNEIKIISFDVEGTLVTTDFSYAIWFEAIPECYAKKNGINPEQAREVIESEYHKVGDQKLEWYDIRYWFDKLSLGTPEPVMQKYQDRVGYYPEVREVLVSLTESYKLIAASGSSKDFLYFLLKDIRPYFFNVYSSITDYRQLKTTEFYVQICRDLQVEPEQIVHIGDNWQFDFVAPNQIGIRAFHLDRQRRLNNENSLASLRELKTRLMD